MRLGQEQGFGQLFLIIWKPHGHRWYGLGDFKHLVYAQREFHQLEDPLKLLVDLVCDEADTNVRFYALCGEMEYRAHLEIALCHPKSPFDHPKAVVFRNCCLRFKGGVCYIAFPPIPFLIFFDFVLIDGNADILGDVEELGSRPFCRCCPS